MRAIQLFSSALLLSLVGTMSGHAEPTYRLDRKQERAVEISGLSNGGECLPDRLSGTVVDREFDKRGALLTSLTIEYDSGERDYVNVDLSGLEETSRLTSGWIIQGLQQMTRKGRRVALRLDRCGAAGRVLYLDGIRPG